MVLKSTTILFFSNSVEGLRLKMNENEIIDKLMKFGLTRQEATIYLCMTKNTELTGYEVSKLTGISRSNAYASLSSLVDAGAAYLLEGTTNKYICVDIDEFCTNKIRELTETKNELIKSIPRIGNACDGYITITNYKHIMDRIHFMLEKAEYRVYISMPVGFLEKIRSDLEKLISDGKKVVLLVDEDVKLKGSIIYKTKKSEYLQVRLIVDSAYVLTGDLSGSANDTCLYCGQPNFVNVFKESLKNEIKLIDLTKNK